MKTIAFFNNKGGVGKTSLAYHLAWMYQDLGIRVVAVDLDPQANLSSMFVEENRLEELWPANPEHPQSILGSISPILRGMGDIQSPHIEPVTDRLGLVVGDLGLSRFEDKLSEGWSRCFAGDESAFRAVSAMYRVIQAAVENAGADLALIDVGPNLGAINRAALIGARYVVIPLAPDLFSLQGLRNLGPTLVDWREQWRNRLQRRPGRELILPDGLIEPIGYIVMQQAVRKDRPVGASARWMERIPIEYRQFVLSENAPDAPIDLPSDPHCLALLKHYRSLMPMAMEARKPMFALKPADGAIGSHSGAVQDCREDFNLLARKIATQCWINIP